MHSVDVVATNMTPAIVVPRIRSEVGKLAFPVAAPTICIVNEYLVASRRPDTRSLHQKLAAG